ncbi:MAG: hydrogenase iron-sulfur subunit [Firmicutes bacterium HGW-Firmicutes-14]|jgi:coenzyme F420-reducing hydrogenase delta subunit|nr:MAG: hydrogenase iron-sulfur subunit [Firmicutes bacterium HGW-Firmicutes-14]
MSTNQNFQPKIVVFACENSGWLAAEHAAELCLSYPEKVEMIKLPCSGKIDVLFFMKALEKADGTAVLACQKENCKFLKGNVRAEQRVSQTGKILKEIGIEEERVGIFYLAANMGHKFTEIVQGFYDKIRELGPNPGKVIK